MLAFNVTYNSEKRLCHAKCQPDSIVVYDIPKCSGLCKPIVKMPEMWQATECMEGYNM